MTHLPIKHAVCDLLLFGTLLLGFQPIAQAGVDDCLKAALNTANPSDLKKAAAFATAHPSCLGNLAPPTLVPYIALSGSLDAANQSGALNKVGLGFNSYQQCVGKVNPGSAAVSQLAPVLKPVCGTLNMDCGLFTGPAAGEVNSQLASEVPLLSLLPCSCAAANSGLGVEKIAELVKQTRQCGATLAQVSEALGDAAKGVYDVAGDAVGVGEDAAAYAVELGNDIAKSVGNVTCAVSKIWGGCNSTPPSYKTAATAICKAHGGTWWAASKTQAPNDIWAQCNDGLYCWAQPGESLRCEQRRTPAQRNSDIAAMKQWCPKREQELETGYKQQCHDGACRIAVANVAVQYGEACMKIATQNDTDPHPSAVLGAEMKDWQGFRENLIISKFDQLIIESIRRDPKTPPMELLRTYDCRSFLGRQDESLCKWPGGYAQCKKLADAGKMKKCHLAGGGEYPAVKINPAVLGALATVNTTRESTASPASRLPPRITVDVEPQIAVSDALLANAAKKGCRPYQNRRDDLQCDTPAGYDECVQAVDRKLVSQCRNVRTGEMYPAQTRLQRKP